MRTFQGARKTSLLVNFTFIITFVLLIKVNFAGAGGIGPHQGIDIITLLPRQKTSITVTQRLRTLLESDLIVIVDKGELVAKGTHIELLRTSEHYRRIFERLPGARQYLRV